MSATVKTAADLVARKPSKGAQYEKIEPTIIAGNADVGLPSESTGRKAEVF